LIIGVMLLSISLALLSPSFRNVWVFGIQVPDVLLLAMIMNLGAIGMGISGPAANNAALDIVPGKVAAIAGMRGMFRSTGGVLGTSLIILALSHYEDKAGGLQTIFFVLSLVILVLIPLVFLIPDAARERRGETPAGGRAPQGATIRPGQEAR
jgi:MFS family permease